MTILISHRGNIDSLKPDFENQPSYIDLAISLGYDVEMDVRVVNDLLFLGHDSPDYQISLQWLLDRKYNLWIHAKNFGALQTLIDYDLRVFYHQKENHTIINGCNLIWSHELSEANQKSIIPLLSLDDISKHSNYVHVYGICSDFISEMKSTNA